MRKIARITLKRKAAGYTVSIHQYAARGRMSLHSRFLVLDKESLGSAAFTERLEAAKDGLTLADASDTIPASEPGTGGS